MSGPPSLVHMLERLMRHRTLRPEAVALDVRPSLVNPVTKSGVCKGFRKVAPYGPQGGRNPWYASTLTSISPPSPRGGSLARRRRPSGSGSSGVVTATTCARSSTDRASDYGSEGWGFESLRARFGSTPPVRLLTRSFGRLAGSSFH